MKVELIEKEEENSEKRLREPKRKTKKNLAAADCSRRLSETRSIHSCLDVPPQNPNVLCPVAEFLLAWLATRQKKHIPCLGSRSLIVFSARCSRKFSKNIVQDQKEVAAILPKMIFLLLQIKSAKFGFGAVSRLDSKGEEVCNYCTFCRA